MKTPATYSYRVTITAGAEQSSSGKLLTQVPHRLVAIEQLLAKQNGGYTETLSYGGWINDDGNLVQEEAYTWTLIVQDTIAPEIGEFTNREVAHEKAMAWAEYIKDTLEQSSIMVSVEKITTRFV